MKSLHNLYLMEDILIPVRDKTTKWMLILCVVSAFIAVGFFIALQNIRTRGGAIAIPLWGGVIGTVLALIFGLIALVRFLRRRSIATGLFVTTTVATLVYSIAARVVRTRGTAGGTPFAPINTLSAGANNAAGGTNNSFFSIITLMQIGLFAVWFLFLLFTIYVYIRPIRRIDYLLTQILEGNEVRKPRVGKSMQYKNIESKLKILADEKQQREQQRNTRLNKSRERNKRQRELMRELLDEQDKLPPGPKAR